MSAEQAAAIVTGVDFVSVPTRDLARAVAFYGTTLGLRRSAFRPERNFAEFETGTVTLSVVDPERMGIGTFSANAPPPLRAPGCRRLRPGGRLLTSLRAEDMRIPVWARPTQTTPGRPRLRRG